MTQDDEPTHEEIMACLACQRNQRQTDLIRKLWAQNRRLTRRCNILQGMVNWFKARDEKARKPTAKEAAEAIFK